MLNPSSTPKATRVKLRAENVALKSENKEVKAMVRKLSYEKDQLEYNIEEKRIKSEIQEERLQDSFENAIKEMEEKSSDMIDDLTDELIQVEMNKTEIPPTMTETEERLGQGTKSASQESKVPCFKRKNQILPSSPVQLQNIMFDDE
eukprot:Seg11137.1 transcript_id=Seg11137.1/GoldUCD/mRNA.D3Y31 product="hypothetical protein" protein_id=Seg11137.1/GoldUCD/D3Y31